MVRTSFLGARILVAVVLFLSRNVALAQALGVEEAVRSRVESVRGGQPLRIANVEAAALNVLPEMYERRGFGVAWTEPRAIDDLLTSVREIGEDGLNPADYHLDTPERLRAEVDRNPNDADLRADLDVLLTDSLTRLAYHLFFGKVDAQSLDANWNFTRQIRSTDAAQTIQDAIDSGALAERIDGLRPEFPAYARLRAALARYRTIAAQGGWPSIPEGPPLSTTRGSRRPSGVFRNDTCWIPMAASGRRRSPR